jgi:hypothetical protein
MMMRMMRMMMMMMFSSSSLFCDLPCLSLFIIVNVTSLGQNNLNHLTQNSVPLISLHRRVIHIQYALLSRQGTPCTREQNIGSAFRHLTLVTL